MEMDLNLRHDSGLATGAVFQFAEGGGPAPVGPGVVVTEEAFDFIEPLIRSAWPWWDSMARYGVTRIEPQSCGALVTELRAASARVTKTSLVPEWLGYSGDHEPSDVARELTVNSVCRDQLAALFNELADWLEEAAKRAPALSLLGI